MKKLIFFMTVLFFAAVLPAETLYYYVEGRKVILTEDFSSYSFIRTTLTKANFVLPQNIKVLKQHKNVSIIEIGDESAKADLVKNGALFPAYIKEGAKVHVSGQIFVKIPGRPNAENAEKWCKKQGLTFVKQYKYVPEWILVSVEGNPVKKAAELVESKAAEAAEPSFFIPLQKRAYQPNDPLFKNQWHLHNDSSNTAVTGNDHAHVAEAWEVMQAFKGNLGGKGVKLAIVDDGFDLDHEDFAGRFTDGYDFVDDDNDPTYNPNKRPYPDEHGTSCAGVAGAATDNGTGVAGACPNCTLIPIRMDMDGYSLDNAAIESFEWAAGAGADIISNSWGPADNGGAVDMGSTLKNLVANLATTGRNGRGIVILFAAGNGDESIDGNRTRDGFANNENVLAIGATNASGTRAYYSDYGKSLDFMAPSCDYSNNGYGDLIDGIWTIDNTGRDGYNSGKSSLGDSKGNYTNDFGGTSSACPLAAGITGLILSANKSLTRDDIYEIYTETSDKVGGVSYTNGFNEKYGYGRINACEAVKKALELGGKDITQVTCGGSVINPGPIDDSDTDDSDTDDPDTTDTADTGDTEPTDTGDTEPTENPADPICGNGIIEGNEICDGNTIPCSNLASAPENGTAECAPDCMSWNTSNCYDSPDDSDAADTDDDKENCGNGIIDEGEQCDDGNRISGDGCSKYCMEEETKSKKSNSGCSLDLI